MSAIVGIYRFTPDINNLENSLTRMLDSLAHRGSDCKGMWIDKVIGLGNRMFWTTPESIHEKLPLKSRCGNYVITCDARIDNRDDLISALGLEKAPDEVLCDSQVILAAYEKWGEDCPCKLLGDFAFAIWNQRNCSLFCARDPVGVKPFYYHLSDRWFGFASEIKALIALPGTPRRLDEIRVADFLAPIVANQERTFYQDIKRLPPAYTLLVLNNQNKSQLKQYWKFNPEIELTLASEEEYIETFKTLFIEAVRCRLRSAFPIGSTLSGGLDSSSIAVTAGKILECKGQQLHTMSAIFPQAAKFDPPLMNVLLSRMFCPPTVILSLT